MKISAKQWNDITNALCDSCPFGEPCKRSRVCGREHRVSTPFDPACHHWLVGVLIAGFRDLTLEATDENA